MFDKQTEYNNWLLFSIYCVYLVVRLAASIGFVLYVLRNVIYCSTNHGLNNTFSFTTTVIPCDRQTVKPDLSILDLILLHMFTLNNTLFLTWSSGSRSLTSRSWLGFVKSAYLLPVRMHSGWHHFKVHYIGSYNDQLFYL